MEFARRADDSGLNDFDGAAQTTAGAALIAHLGGDFVFGGHLAHGAGFANVVADRFLAIDRFAELHRDHGGKGVLMIRRGDEDGVDVFADGVAIAGTGAFGIGAAYVTTNNGVDDGDSDIWVAGVDYTTGPYKIGGSYLNAQTEEGAVARARRPSPHPA